MAPRAFTLIELLVVITIIVVLLALLTPALDKAVYQAQLAVCGSKLHAISGGVLVYAANNKRQYPYRIYTDLKRVGKARPVDIQYSNWGGAPPNGIDDRPVLRTFLNLNDHLNCPLAPAKADIEGSKTDTNIILSYALWFSFRYTGERGMARLGDRLVYAGESFDLLVSDWSGVNQGANEWTGHNDSDGKMESWTYQDTDYNTDQGLLNYTFSTWITRANGERRGPIDLHYGASDGSVARHDRVPWDEGADGKDQRITLLPQWNLPSNQPIAKVQVPRH